MNTTDSDFKKLVQAAHKGDKEALQKIVEQFSPLIKKVKGKTAIQERDDLEQELIEKIIRAILNYDISRTIDISQLKKCVETYCQSWKEVDLHL